MPSFNKIASQIASRLNRPFDDMLKSELKDLFIGELDLLLRRTINKSGIDRQYTASFIVSLQKVDSADNIIEEQGTSILRSVNRIPSPIRFDAPVPFIYIGAIDGSRPYGYVNNYYQAFLTELSDIASTITYDWIDNYLYVYNAITIVNEEEVYPTATKIIAPYSDYRLLNNQTSGSKGIPYTDDMELPFPLDLINTATASILDTILNNLDVKDKVEASHLDNQ